PVVCVCENAGIATKSCARHSSTISRNLMFLIHFLRAADYIEGIAAVVKGFGPLYSHPVFTHCSTEVHLGSDRLARRLGLFDATMLVMGGIVGSGIFMNPYVVARVVHTPVLILGAWIFGGAVALTGAFIYGELAARRPQVGGQYAYIREAFNPAV